jgi:molybdopterin/thiamine biosynthesis adenylyltransferase
MPDTPTARPADMSAPRRADFSTIDLGAGPSYVTCPSTESVLLDDGTLLLIPVRGREQLQVDSPWGRMVHDVVVRGVPVEQCVSALDRATFDETIRYLAVRRVLLPADQVAAVDVERFDRQVRWFAQEGVDGPAAQRRLAMSTVLMLGVGGFGAPFAELLARAGVGTIALADSDRVEEQNLPRQLLFTDRDIGVRKVFAAAMHLEQIAPDSNFVAIDQEITCAEDVAKLVRRVQPDLVVCAADRPPQAIKEWVDAGAFALGIPVLHGGARPPFAYAGPLLVPGVTSCYACFYASRVAPGSEELEAEVSIRRNEDPPALPAVGWADVTAASMCAGQAISLLGGIHGSSMLGREFELDIRTMESEWMEPGCHVECPRCTDRSSAV